MKRLTVVLAVALAAWATGCLQKAASKPGAQFGALVRWHFAGSTQVARDPGSAKLRQIAALPATAELREQTLLKLARTPHAFWQGNLPAGVTDQSALIRPLLDDLISAESAFEVRGTVERPETVLALQLADDRATLWEKSLSQLVQNWKLGTPQPATVEGFKGWELKRKEAPQLVRFVRARNWVLLSLGPERPTVEPAWLQQIAKSGRPVQALQNLWLDVQADAPALRKWVPAFTQFQLPPTHLTLVGKGEYLRTEARLYFSDNIPWKQEPWQLPLKSIRDPIISFTVGQGIAPILESLKGFSDLGLKQTPNQFCLWAQPSMFSQTYASMPVPDATNTMRQLAHTLPSFLQAQFPQAMGHCGYVSNRHELFWKELPLVVPYLRPLRDGQQDFLVAGMFPPIPGTNPPPPELLSQINGRKNLVYYDWEITQERLVHARPLNQLLDIVNRRQFPRTNAPGQKWLRVVGPLLGNTVTEITSSAPKELSLVRNSHIGFTGAELESLARWLDAPGFPLKFEPNPPMSALRTNAAFRATNTTSRPKR